MIPHRLRLGLSRQGVLCWHSNSESYSCQGQLPPISKNYRSDPKKVPIVGSNRSDLMVCSLLSRLDHFFRSASVADEKLIPQTPTSSGPRNDTPETDNALGDRSDWKRRVNAPSSCQGPSVTVTKEGGVCHLVQNTNNVRPLVSGQRKRFMHEVGVQGSRGIQTPVFSLFLPIHFFPSLRLTSHLALFRLATPSDWAGAGLVGARVLSNGFPKQRAANDTFTRQWPKWSVCKSSDLDLAVSPLQGNSNLLSPFPQCPAFYLLAGFSFDFSLPPLRSFPVTWCAIFVAF